MITYRRILVRVVSMLALVLLGAGPAAYAGSVAPESRAPSEVDNIGGRLKAELKKRGFEVAEGYFQLWRIEDCPQSFEVMGTCYFNNPTAPYVLAVVPYWPDEFVDPATQGAFGATDPGYGTTFRFDPNEAIVIFGFLPPKAAYFGHTELPVHAQGRLPDGQRYVPPSSTRSAPTDVFFHTVPASIPSALGLSTA